MERHGSFSKGTLEYWKAAVHVAHERHWQKTSEFPVHLSVLTRRVFQTLAVALWRVNASHILQYHRRAFDVARRVVSAQGGGPCDRIELVPDSCRYGFFSLLNTQHRSNWAGEWGPCQVAGAFYKRVWSGHKAAAPATPSGRLRS